MSKKTRPSNSRAHKVRNRRIQKRLTWLRARVKAIFLLTESGCHTKEMKSFRSNKYAERCAQAHPPDKANQKPKRFTGGVE